MTEAYSFNHSFDSPQLGIADSVDIERYVSPSPRSIGILKTEEMHGKLLQFARGDAAEMEFSLASHLIMFFPDGMSGGCEWSNGGHDVKSSCMPPNTVIFNPAQNFLRLRKRSSQAPCRILFLAIAPKGMSRLSVEDAADVVFEQTIGVNDEDVRRTLLTFLQEIESPGWNSKFYVETLFTLLMSQLVRCASNLGGKKRLIYRKGGLAGRRLKQALELLESDLCEAPSVTELARDLQLHPTSLCRAFKQSMGVTPHRYLLSHRIKRAKEMMRDQHRTLTEIAIDCGFNSSSQFSVVFKRMVGTTPREYRHSL